MCKNSGLQITRDKGRGFAAEISNIKKICINKGNPSRTKVGDAR